MTENSSYYLLALDANYCPDTDAVLGDKDCSGCSHYKGFQLYHGQRCVKCSYSKDIQQDEES